MDPYVYPGTNVLKNLRDIRDAGFLAEFEADATSYRIRQLARAPTKGSLNAAHLRAIHHHIFQDVYEWAGEYRTVDIARGGQFYFAFPGHIASCLDELLAKLAKEPLVTYAAKFCNRAAHYLGELNAVHPFRDGNGRTQREFIRQFGLRCGYRLYWVRVTRDQMYATSHGSFERADNSGLEEVIRSALSTGKS